MPLLDRLCRLYQSAFPASYAEQRHLVEEHTRGDAAGDKAAYYRLYFDHEYDKGRRALDRFAAVTRAWEGGRALDFGCGGGGLTVRLRERLREAVGIDLDAGKLDFARAEADRRGVTGVEFICYPGGPLPFPDAAFDCVVCVDVMEHLPDPAAAVAEFRRVLRPGGWLLLSFGPPWLHAHGKHMWDRLPGWWVHLLFPRPVVMRAARFPPTTTWADLGLHRLTVGKFERVMRGSGFETVYQHYLVNTVARPLRRVPGLRELVIAEVVGVYRNPSADPSAAA